MLHSVSFTPPTMSLLIVYLLGKISLYVINVLLIIYVLDKFFCSLNSKLFQKMDNFIIFIVTAGNRKNN